MSQTATGTAHFIGASPVGVGASAVTVDCWVNPVAVGQLRRYIGLANSSNVNNALSLGSDAVSSSTNQASTFVDAAGTTTQALSADVIATATWNYLAGSWASNNAPTCTGPAGSKATKGGFTTPTGINETLFSGRTGDFASGWNGQGAHFAAWTRVLNDLEITYRRSGGNARWLSPARYWKFTSGQTPVTDEMGVENLVVTSAAAGTSDPILATYWTASAFGNQSYTQGSAISTVNLTTKFDQMAAAVDYSTTLQQLSVPGAATTAVGSAVTATNILVVASATGFAAGGYASVTNNTTPTLILALSGTTLLLAAMKTWAASDNVYPFTVSPLTINGLSITSNSFSGTPGAPAVGTYLNCLFRAANTTTATLIADSPLFNVTVSSSGAAPSFSVGPTLTSANTDGYTFTATSNQTATWWQGVYVRGSTTPTAANVIAGTGTGFVSHFSTAVTIASAGTNVSTGLANPIYDVYHALTNGNGNSALSSFTAQLKAPPAGKQYMPAVVSAISAITKASPASITATAHGRTTGDFVQVFGVAGMTQINGTFFPCTVVDANTFTLPIDSTGFTSYSSGGIASWGKSLYSGASTLVATGDVGIGPLATTEDGLPLTIFPNGAISILAGNVTRRQTFAFDFYSVSANALIGSATSYEHDVAPNPPNGLIVAPGLFVAANQTISVNAGTIALDVQGDTLSVSLSGLPSPLSLSGVNIVGTTGASSITPVTGTWTNNSTDSTTAIFNLVIGSVNPPNLQGLLQPQIDAALAQIYVTANYGTQDDNSIGGPAAQGVAIAQNPPFGIPVLPNTVINVSLSSGQATPVNPVVTVSTSQSSQIVMEETLGRLNQFPPVEAYAVCACAVTDQAGQVYRFFRVPSGARIMQLYVMNSGNPTGSSYQCGLFISPAGAPVTTKASSVLFGPLSMDLARSTWTDVYAPTQVGGAAAVTNVGLRVWELLGLAADPSSSTLVDVLYDVAITALTPGQTGGNIALRVQYLPAPPRGLATAAESPW
jgi:Ubiquitin-activating enzyme E1 FCCH domain